MSGPGRLRPGALLELAIDELGARGDGIARLAGGRVLVPLTLPGERWRVRLATRKGGDWRARAVERLGGASLDGPARVDPPCRHFGRCGSCALQHLPADAYAAFKRERVAVALRRAGLPETLVEEPLISPPGSRRRVRLGFVRGQGGRTRLGYRERLGRALVPIEVCPIALPAIERVLAPLAACLDGLDLAAGGGEVAVTATDEGLDVLLRCEDAASLADRERLAAFADCADLARLSLAEQGMEPAPVAVRRTPVVRLGGLRVDLPAGAFLQATEQGEAALQRHVRDWVPQQAAVLDLYAGLGTLSLPLLGHARRLVLAESEPSAVAAARSAVQQAGIAGVEPVRRDLEREPYLERELAAFDCVLLDPPRAGAAAQARALAASAVPRVVYASCDPGSFARDARVLAQGGLALRAVQPVDQFLYSPEVELVALFSREERRKGG
ncbi:23S rRNA (uracil(1939)-C(5))-methyltransferase RlmD [Geminicoccaceae bacterium 1502E]|nr:23S rRNA (uracil(1939)-C(5))-methyltransferase RlmD [Geminicoccaceae bacterium 1502E]